jgi:Polyketide cyclase / dehydrase and lipid transport
MPTTATNTHRVSASAQINAAPEKVYGILADYRNGHPRILPKQFSNLTVESGGIGAGTVIRFQATVLGRTQNFRAEVTEPEPGRVLLETNLAPNESRTTFTVNPGIAPGTANVTIATELPITPGLLASFERTLAAKFMQSMYREELALLAAFAEREEHS